MLSYLKKTDPAVAEAIRNEIIREESKLVLIASENYVSEAVLEAVGSVLTNKYAEGYPFKRYYGGCENADIVEKLAIDRAKELFGADHVNVQPHSGSTANMGVFLSVLNHGDNILGMELSHGGHLTHGYKINFSGKLFNAFSYCVDRETFLIDYDELLKVAKQVKPKMIIAGASSYSRFLDFKKFSEIAAEVGAYFMADIAHIAGLVVAGIHSSPVHFADFVSTTTHKTLRGPRGGMVLCKEKYAKNIDYAIFPGIQGGPIVNIIAGKAVAFKEALTDSFKKDQHQIVKNAKALSNSLMQLGYNVVSGGTDNHLFVIDLSNKGLNGSEAQNFLDNAGIVLNRNAVPYDSLPPAITSGIRLGTPIVTTRGMKEEQMNKIALFIDKVLSSRGNESVVKQVREEVTLLTSQFPYYKNLLSKYDQ